MSYLITAKVIGFFFWETARHTFRKQYCAILNIYLACHLQLDQKLFVRVFSWYDKMFYNEIRKIVNMYSKLKHIRPKKALCVKVQIFWEGHKNLAHLPLMIRRCKGLSKKEWKMGQIFMAFSEYLNLAKIQKSLWLPWDQWISTLYTRGTGMDI